MKMTQQMSHCKRLKELLSHHPQERQVCYHHHDHRQQGESHPPQYKENHPQYQEQSNFQQQQHQWAVSPSSTSSTPRPSLSSSSLPSPSSPSVRPSPSSEKELKAPRKRLKISIKLQKDNIIGKSSVGKRDAVLIPSINSTDLDEDAVGKGDDADGVVIPKDKSANNNNNINIIITNDTDNGKQDQRNFIHNEHIFKSATVNSNYNKNSNSPSVDMEGAQFSSSSSSYSSTEEEEYNDSDGSESESEEEEFHSSYEEERAASHRQRQQQEALRRNAKQKQRLPARRRRNRSDFEHDSRNLHSKNFSDLVNLLSSSLEWRQNSVVVSELATSSSSSSQAIRASAGAASNSHLGEDTENHHSRGNGSGTDSSSTTIPGMSSWSSSLLHNHRNVEGLRTSDVSISFRPPLLALSKDEHAELGMLHSRERKTKHKNNQSNNDNNNKSNSSDRISENANVTFHEEGAVGCVVTLHVHSSSDRNKATDDCNNDRMKSNGIKDILNQVTSLNSLAFSLQEKIQSVGADNFSSTDSNSRQQGNNCNASLTASLSSLSSPAVATANIHSRPTLNSKKVAASTGSFPFLRDEEKRLLQRLKQGVTTHNTHQEPKKPSLPPKSNDPDYHTEDNIKKNEKKETRITAKTNHNKDGCKIYAMPTRSLLCDTIDDLNTIIDSVDVFRDFVSTSSLSSSVKKRGRDKGMIPFGKEEISWWSFRDPSPYSQSSSSSSPCVGTSTRNLAFLRRMFLPLCCRVIVKDDDISKDGPAFSTKKDAASVSIKISSSNDDESGNDFISNDNSKISIKCKLLPNSEAIITSSSSEKWVDNNSNMKIEERAQSPPAVTTATETRKTILCPVSYSLIDVLLHIESLQPNILAALMYRVYQLDERIQRATPATASTATNPTSINTDTAAAKQTTKDEQKKNTNTARMEDSNEEVMSAMHRSLRNLILSTINEFATRSHLVDKPAFVNLVLSILAKSSSSSSSGRRKKLRNDLLQTLPNILCDSDITDEEIEKAMPIMSQLSSSRNKKDTRRNEIQQLEWWGEGANNTPVSAEPKHQPLLCGVGDSRSAVALLPMHSSSVSSLDTCSTFSPPVDRTMPLINSSNNSDNNGTLKEQIPEIERCKMEAKSCPNWKRSEVMSIRKEREKILQNRRMILEKKVKSRKHLMQMQQRHQQLGPIRRSTRRVKPQGRSSDGSLVISSQDMSIDEFLARTTLMGKVNATLPRLFIPNVSRPTLRRLSLSKQTVSELQNLFFDSDGSLNNSIRNDVDMSVKNGYINFENKACLEQRQDKRWQVPFRHHGVGHEIETRAKVEALFHKEGVLEPFKECLDDLGLLFGGTEDQSLHHDTARQVTSWVDEKPLTDDVISTLNPVSGWEIDRLEYNDAMSSPVAPSSLIVGLGGNEEVLLGVQKDQIDRVGDGTSCKIHGGLNETFDIVRQNDHLVVIRVRTGCMFTGDFPHAGVRNICRNTPKDLLMEKFNGKIMDIINEYPAREHVLRTKAIVDMMCNFPGLDTLCRLHCSTEMLEGNLCIPANTIGFSECLPNLPDMKCLGND